MERVLVRHYAHKEPTNPTDAEIVRLARAARDDLSLRRLPKPYQLVALWLIEHPELDPQAVSIRDVVNVDSGPHRSRLKVGAGRGDRGWNIAVSLYRQTVAGLIFRKRRASALEEPAFMDGDVPITKAMLLDRLRELAEAKP